METAERKAGLGEVRQLALGNGQYRIGPRIEDRGLRTEDRAHSETSKPEAVGSMHQRVKSEATTDDGKISKLEIRIGSALVFGFRSLVSSVFGYGVRPGYLDNLKKCKAQSAWRKALVNTEE